MASQSWRSVFQALEATTFASLSNFSKLPSNESEGSGETKIFQRKIKQSEEGTWKKPEALIKESILKIFTLAFGHQVSLSTPCQRLSRIPLDSFQVYRQKLNTRVAVDPGVGSGFGGLWFLCEKLKGYNLFIRRDWGFVPWVFQYALGVPFPEGSQFTTSPSRICLQASHFLS